MLALVLALVPLGAGAQECDEQTSACALTAAAIEEQCAAPAPGTHDGSEAAGDEAGPAIPALPGQDPAADGDPAADDPPAADDTAPASDPRCEPTEGEPADVPAAPAPTETSPTPSVPGEPAIPALPVTPVEDGEPGAVADPLPVRAQGQGEPTQVAPPPAAAPPVDPPAPDVRTDGDRTSVSEQMRGRASGPRLSSATAPDDDVANRIELAPQVARSDELEQFDDLALAEESSAAPVPMAAPPAPPAPASLGILPVTYAGDGTGWQHGVASLVMALVLLLATVWFGTYAATVAQPAGHRGLEPRRRRQRLRGHPQGVAAQRGHPSA
jgi:hypothetical protein